MSKIDEKPEGEEEKVIRNKDQIRRGLNISPFEGQRN